MPKQQTQKVVLVTAKKRRNLKPKRNRKKTKPGKRQAMLTQVASSRLGVMQQQLGVLAKVLTLPGDTQPIRFPTQEFGSQPSAVWRFVNSISVDYTGIAVPNQTAFLCSSPISPVWASKTLVANSGASTKYVCGAEYFPIAEGSTYSGSGDFYRLELRNYISYTTPVTYPAKRGGTMYQYCPHGSTLNLEFYNILANGNVVFEIAYAPLPDNPDAEEKITRAQRTVTTGYNQFQFLMEGATPWVRLRGVSFNLTGMWDGTTFAKVVTGACLAGVNITCMLPLLNCPAIGEINKPFSQMRQNSVSCLMTNVGPPLYRNGSVRGARLYYADQSVFDSDACNTAIGQINAKLRFTGGAEKGIYTFMVPTKESLTWSDYLADYDTVTDTEPKNKMILDLGDFSSVNFISFNAKTTDDGLRFNVVMDQHLEAITGSEVYEIGTPVIDPDKFKLACSAAGNMVPFTENPLHPVLLGLGRILLRNMLPYAAPLAQKGVEYLTSKLAKL